MGFNSFMNLKPFGRHQSKREYDPTMRPWYYKGATARGVPAVSTPYLDASGSGKVVILKSQYSKIVEYALDIKSYFIPAHALAPPN